MKLSFRCPSSKKKQKASWGDSTSPPFEEDIFFSPTYFTIKGKKKKKKNPRVYKIEKLGTHLSE